MMDFNTVFTVRVNDERYMWRYKLHPPHLINIATLPCDTLNSENVISQWDITKENDISNVSHMLKRNGPADCKIWSVTQQRIQYETKICDIYDLQKRFTQTWIDSEQNVIEAAIDQWRDRLRSCVHIGGGHFEHMLWNYCSFVLCGSLEHFMKLSV